MEDKILKLFLFNHKLKFNELEKQLKVRSNKLDYHLKKLVSKNILEKIGDFYSITSEYEHIIPYLSEKKHVLTVILVHIGDKNNAYLVRRVKRPFKDKLGFPGGRIILGEDVSVTCERIMKEKFGIKVKYEKTMSISLEHITNKKNIVQSDMVIYVQAKASDLNLMNIEDNKREIIASDYYLMKKDHGKNVEIKNLKTKI